MRLVVIEGFVVPQQASAQEVALTVGHPLLDLERGFAVDPHASALGAQWKLADAQNVIEARELV